ncbi:transcription-repair coupling factor [Fodinibius salsisoli]|uniref:Transcription-repair-coupling factor n=1 Tax=Fodinibius salsisoli TaxID=2820877 RepID=A0ABT3PN29_9BACT|nr:transcription-repair coupling factor [Fodinibius salsisoli]MCW9707342.1 transcription-repair coupling factor [Fodinibius salsisoli]
MALQSVLKTFSGQIPWQDLNDHIGEHNKVLLDHFIGSTPALLAAKLAEKYNKLVIIHPEAEAAQFMKDDLEALDVAHASYFPATGQKPYDDQQITDSSIVVQRSEVLENIKHYEQAVLVSSAAALFDKLVAPEVFTDASITINNGDSVNFEKLRKELVDQEYEPVKFVNQPGEFAHRGGILDVFPYTGEYPIRLEFFGDEVDSIREFDPDSQRSIAFLETVRFVPDASNLNQGEKRGLLSYFDEDTLILIANQSLVQAELEDRYEQAIDRFEQIEDEDILPPEDLYVGPNQFTQSIQKCAQLHLGGFSKEQKADWTYRLEASPQPDFNGNIKLLREDIESLSKQGYDTYILCDNEGQRDRFEELLGEPSKNLRYHLSVETIHQGFLLNEKGLAVYTDHQIFNRYHRPKVRRKRHTNSISFKELRDLNIGDYVVHVDYGIGKFAGFKTIEVRDVEQESVVLRYKEDSVLYVNVSSLHKIQKYSGKEGTQPRIDKLGSGRWARKKAETKTKVKDIARDLIKLYAKRKSQDAFDFAADNSWQTEMEARFEFEETPDQRKAIKAVKQDMQSDTPMDRLICGDVGFGKTEVAVRAAFKAVMDHKQVAVLVPTTILADQHYKTFKKRMKDFPVSIDVISRFRSRKEQKETLQRLEEGKVDIIVGTHRLTSKDVKFDDLGLLVVDEEQRFGVSAKEKLKKYRATVDVLTLTATPIPRTLQFSLMGARDLSIIHTPPPNRQPVETEIHSFNEDLIRDAITQEISRGGQVFFIHNRVKNIEAVANMVRKLVPNIRIRHAHGQMSSKKLETIIEDFYDHKFDVLLSTNIVENGIDISNANTMIINRADRFGLAELHQLRGRVGRSNRKAFCYLITPDIKSLTDEARKRLLALEEFSDLGSGFNIAMRDLDIRGAGDILGAEQSGFINDLGFDLYQKILNDAVKELKENEFSDVFDDVEVQPDLPETQVEFDLPALLPSNYVADNVERLNLYRKLSGADELEEIKDWKEEVQDRFGPVPNATQNIITSTVIKLFASRLFMTKARIRSNRMWLSCPKHDSELGEEFYGNRFQKLLKTLQEEAEDRFKVIQKDDRVRFVIHDISDLQAAASFLKELSSVYNREVSFA